MSAIAGLYHLRQANAELTDLDRMASALRHRGSDAPSVWHVGSVGLVRCLLQTTPQSVHEDHSLASRDGLYALSADARLDNRRELFSHLDFSGRPLTEIPDSAFLLAAYRRWGERCVDHLVGDFSFALWDERERKLFCARDHMGIRPFYYYQAGTVFCFASEINALLQLSMVRRRINEAKLLDFLLWEYQDKTATFYQDIFRLPPAHTLTISADGIQIRQYWQLDSMYELRLGSDADYVEQFLEIFREAVQDRFSAIGPVGSMLSGGLDSSAVTCTARNFLGQTKALPLATFSAIYPSQPQVDESGYIAHVVDQGGIMPYFLRADEFGPLGDGTQAVRYFEEPNPFPNLSMLSGLLRMAKGLGIDVMLDGVDGDAAVSHGLGILLEVAYKGRWGEFAALATALGQKYPAHGDVSGNLLKGYGFYTLSQLVRDGRWLAAGQAVTQISQQFGMSPIKIVQSALFAPLIMRPLRRLKRGRKPPPDVSAWLSPDFVRRIDFAQRDRAMRQNQIRPVRTARQEQVNTLTSCWLMEALDATDKTAAAIGIELRHPFFDKRLVEFCLAVPVNQKIDGGWTRVILRRAMQNILPTDIQWREGKSNLEPNFFKSFAIHNRPQIEKALVEAPAPLEPYLNITAIRAIYDDLVANPSFTAAARVWSATQLWYWLEQQ